MPLITVKSKALADDATSVGGEKATWDPLNSLSDAAFLKTYGKTKDQYRAEAANTQYGSNKPKDVLAPVTKAAEDLATGRFASSVAKAAAAPLPARVLDAATKAAQANPTVNRAVAAVEKQTGKTGILPATIPAAVAAGYTSAAKDAINPALKTIESQIPAAQATLQDLLSGARDWFNGAGSQPIVAPQVPGLVSSGAYGNVGTGFNPIGAVQAPGMSFQGAQDSSQYSPQQAELIQAILQRASGTGGPSPAELMLAAQNQQAVNQAMALAASQSGRAAPVAQRQIMQQQALGAQQAAQQAAILRAQEMLQAQQLGSQAIQGARGQDIQLTQFNQQQRQAADERNLNAELEASKANAANALGMQQSQLSAATTQRGQDIAAQTAALQAEADRQAGLQRRKDEMIRGLISGAAAAYTGGVA